MPRSKAHNRAYMRDYMRPKRAKAKLAKAAAVPKPPADPAGALAQWSRKVLTVPPGHAAAGQPMVLPGFANGCGSPGGRFLPLRYLARLQVGPVKGRALQKTDQRLWIRAAGLGRVRQVTVRR